MFWSEFRSQMDDFIQFCRNDMREPTPHSQPWMGLSNLLHIAPGYEWSLSKRLTLCSCAECAVFTFHLHGKILASGQRTRVQFPSETPLVRHISVTEKQCAWLLCFAIFTTAWLLKFSLRAAVIRHCASSCLIRNGSGLWHVPLTYSLTDTPNTGCGSSKRRKWKS